MPRLSLRLAALAVVTACVTASPPRGVGEARESEPARVCAARRSQAAALARLFESARVLYPAHLVIVAFKLERRLELWGYSRRSGRYVRVAAYPFLGSSGGLGPKRRSGDHQIPEGFYRVTLLNPASLYHLSLKLDYPNASDRVLGNRRDPGGDIFIHGGRDSDGCIPIGNPAIEQLFLAVFDSLAVGYRVPVEIFPCRFSDSGCRALLRMRERGRSDLAGFWGNLETGFDLFARSGIPPAVSADSAGYTYAAATPPPKGPLRLARGPRS